PEVDVASGDGGHAGTGSNAAVLELVAERRSERLRPLRNQRLHERAAGTGERRAGASCAGRRSKARGQCREDDRADRGQSKLLHLDVSSSLERTSRGCPRAATPQVKRRNPVPSVP